jgi:hypothetical protein
MAVALAVTITGLLLFAACWLWRYGTGIADVTDRDDLSD